MMWFWKSSDVSGICTAVDLRLEIHRLPRKSDKEHCESLKPTVTACPSADTDVRNRPLDPIFDLASTRMEDLNPAPAIFITAMKKKKSPAQIRR